MSTLYPCLQDFVRSTTKYWVHTEDIGRVKYILLQVWLPHDGGSSCSHVLVFNFVPWLPHVFPPRTTAFASLPSEVDGGRNGLPAR